MNLDSIDIVFRSILLINIFYLIQMLLKDYIKPILITAHETEQRSKQNLYEKIEFLQKNITQKEFEFVETTKTLLELEKKIATWHQIIEKEYINQQRMQQLLIEKYTIALEEQQKLHTHNKEQKILLQTCSIDALETIQKENPELLDLYTKKQLHLLAADEEIGRAHV